MASVKRQVMDEIRDRFDEDRAREIIDSAAFGALVWRVREWCQNNCGDPSSTFEKLSEDDVEFAADGAGNPAAFLAARIRDL